MNPLKSLLSLLLVASALFVAPHLAGGDPPPSPQPTPQSQPVAPEPPKIAGQDVVLEHRLVRFTVSGIPPGYFILWDVYPPEDIDPATQKLKSVYEFAAPPGTYKVRVRAFKPDSESPLEAWRTVVVQPRAPPPGPAPGPGPAPTPPGPIPPGPTPPGPVPPTPPAPIPVDGGHVLIVYETGQLHPPAQAAIFTSGVLRDYLDKHTLSTPTDGTGGRAYRIWDQHVNLAHPAVAEKWRTAMARPRQSLPWIVVSNGRTGYEGPLPPDVPQTLALIKKYLGE